MILLASLQVGQPRTYPSPQGPWTSAIAKAQVAAAVAVAAGGVAGDKQADLAHHGGPHKAVLAYAAAHYAVWARELGRELPAGGFGENFTVSGAEEATVCIGDRWRIGALVLEVSQPREPCTNPARFWRVCDLAQRMRASDRTGWYLRVLAPGEAVAGAAIEVVARPHPEWTVARANRLFYQRDDPAALRALAGCALLSPGWRARLGRYADTLARPSPA